MIFNERIILRPEVKSRVQCLFGWVWIAVLFYVVIGALVAHVLDLTNFIEPYCTELPQETNTYPICNPCGMHGSVFGAIESNSCPNPFKPAFLNIIVAGPRVVEIGVSLLVYPLVELLRNVATWLPTIVLIPGVGLLLFLSIYKNFFKNRFVKKGLNRVLLSILLLLGTLMALSG